MKRFEREQRKQRKALDRFVGLLFTHEPAPDLYRFQGFPDPDGAVRVTGELIERFKRLSMESKD